jgi:hypothetical protein
MGKIIEAKCSQGQVSILNKSVVGVPNSEGVGESEGWAFVDEGVVVYFPNQSLDLKDILDQLDDVLTKLVTVLSGLDGATNAPGAQSANIAQVSASKAQLQAIKAVLR